MDSKMKIGAIVAVLIIVVAAAAAVMMSNGSDTEEEKKGLYRLDAKVSEVSMGQCSATPSVIITLETLYKDYYGDFVKTGFTIDDVKKDQKFWDKYCVWTPIIKDNGDGTYDVTSTTKAKGNETVTIPKADAMVSMGTMYSETVYTLLCYQYGVEPNSSESLKNESIGKDFARMVVGGMQYSYYEEQDCKFMTAYVDKANYLDLGVVSVQKVDAEELTKVMKTAKGEDKNVVYFGSGTRMSEEKYYNANTEPCKKTGTYYEFLGPSSITDVYSAIDVIGKIMGFDQKVIDEAIQDFQIRLYTIYNSVEEKTSGTTEKVKAYWEAANGKAVKSSMGKTIVEFLGFDGSLMDGAEHDLESLLVDKPSLIIFYTNDGRSMDERMRANL